MSLPEIQKAIEHILERNKCIHCDKELHMEDLHVVASTKNELLLEVRCGECQASSLITVVMTASTKEKGENGDSKELPNFDTVTENTDRIHQEITPNDVLDMKNFLNNFDGNFKKLFSPKK